MNNNKDDDNNKNNDNDRSDKKTKNNNSQCEGLTNSSPMAHGQLVCVCVFVPVYSAHSQEPAEQRIGGQIIDSHNLSKNFTGSVFLLPELGYVFCADKDCFQRVQKNVT